MVQLVLLGSTTQGGAGPICIARVKFVDVRRVDEPSWS